MFTKTKDQILEFENSNDILNLDGLNTKLDIENNDFGIIQNMFYHKISNNPKILLLSDSANPSLYPLINEIAIDKKRFNIFKSNWDDNYYNTYTTNIYNNSLKGTRNMIESKSFLGSKVMTIPTEIVLDNFITSQTIQLQSNINSNINSLNVNRNTVLEELLESDTNEIFGTSSNLEFVLTIDLSKRIIRYIKDNGIGKNFDDLLELYSSGDDTLLDDDINSYITNNILNRYKISDIKIFIKSNDTNTFNFNTSFDELISSNYLRTKNFNRVDNNDFNITLRIPKTNINTSISVIVDMEII